MDISSSNYINFEDEELNLPIYRVVTVERLLELFYFKEIVLVKPEKWDDPYENLMLKANCQLENGEKISLSGIMKKFYGQCWTLEDENDGMWRIYAPYKNGVIIQTTVKKLLEAIWDSDDINADRKCFIGKVLYEDEKEIKDIFENIYDNINTIIDPTNYLQALTFFVKRKEFANEKEVRIIYRSDVERDIQRFSVEPDALIDKVIFDPRMSDNLCKLYHGLIQSLGFKGQIRQSTLYTPPDINITFKNKAKR